MEVQLCILSLVGITQTLVGFTQANISRQEILRNFLDHSKYDSSVTPDYDLNIPTNITVQIAILNIFAVRESEMDFSIDVYLRQKWIDSRLAYGNMTSADWIEMDNRLMDNIWSPDTFFTNEKRAHLHDVTVPNKLMHLYRNGTVLYSIRLSLTLTCFMNLQKYPFDEQRCPIFIESYAYTVNTLFYYWNPVQPVQIYSSVEMPQFDSDKHVITGTCDKQYGETGDFSCINAEIILQRKLGYYIVQMFVPSVLIVALSWVSFWVDYDAVPARVSLGIMTVLTMTTQSAGGRQTLPHVSYIKAIDVWMAACLLFVFASLLEYAYVNVIARRKLRTLSYTHNSTAPTNKVGTPSLADATRSMWLHDGQARRVDKVSRVCFPATFLAFNVAFYVYYTVSPNH